jgi:hydrogen cyanide synthase HcnC
MVPALWRTNLQEVDVTVIGGGLVGAALAYGLATKGRKVVVLDGGDVAHRASRGNFGLVWVRGKGAGRSNRQASMRPFRELCTRKRGLPSGCAKKGRFTRGGSRSRATLASQLRQEAGNSGYDCTFLDRARSRHCCLASVLP